MTELELVVVAVDDRIPDDSRRDPGACRRRPAAAVHPRAATSSSSAVPCSMRTRSPATASPRPAIRSQCCCVPTALVGRRWLHRELRVGDTVLARGPRSAFAPVLRATRHLLVAAGIGITPMVSHLRSARRWGREVELLYVHRPGRGAHVDDVEALTDDATIFTDRESFAAALNHALANQPLGTHLYVCGPDVLHGRRHRTGGRPGLAREPGARRALRHRRVRPRRAVRRAPEHTGDTLHRRVGRLAAGGPAGARPRRAQPLPAGRVRRMPHRGRAQARYCIGTST